MRKFNKENRMLSNKDKFYIELIRFGVNNIESGVTIDEAKDYLSNKGYQLQKMADFFDKIFNQLFQQHLNNSTQDNNQSKSNTVKYTIRMEAYFNLIQYKANKNTTYAFYAAIFSVIIATATLIITIITSK